MKPARKQTETGPPIGVIEEVADNIYSIKFILQSLGYQVRSFCFRDDFYLDLEHFNPQLLIIDMMIPEGAAFDVIRNVRLGDLKRVPLLAITADAMKGNQEGVFEAGGQDVLQKPYSVTQLQEKLEKWVGQTA